MQGISSALGSAWLLGLRRLCLPCAYEQAGVLRTPSPALMAQPCVSAGCCDAVLSVLSRARARTPSYPPTGGTGRRARAEPGTPPRVGDRPTHGRLRGRIPKVPGLIPAVTRRYAVTGGTCPRVT